MKSWIKKIKPNTYLLGGLLVIIILCLWSTPWWMPYAIKPLAYTKGLQYSYKKAQRDGIQYTSWLNIEGSYESYSFKIDRITIPTLSYLVYHHVLYSKSPPLFISRINIIGDKSYKKPTEIKTHETSDSFIFYEAHNTFIEAYTLWGDWRPLVKIDNVKAKIDNHKWFFQKISWDALQFHIPKGWSSKIGNFTVSLSLISPQELLAKGYIEDIDASLSLKSKEHLDQLSIRGALKVVDSPIFIRGVFNNINNRPISLRVDANDFIFPHTHLKIPLDAEVRTDFFFIWADRQYGVDLKASTYSLTDPTLRLGTGIASIRGTTSGLSVDQINFQGPSLNITLSKPFTFSFDDLDKNKPGTLDLNIDFAKQDLLPLRGIFKATASITPDLHSIAKVSLKGKGAQLEIGGLKVQDIPIHIICQWPILNVDIKPVRFEEGSQINFTGTLDFEHHSLEKLNLNATLTHRFNTVFNLLPFQFNHFTLIASANGSWDHFPWGLTHATEINAKQLKFENIKPLDLKWSNVAKGKTFSNASLDIRADEASLSWSGAFSFSDKKRDIKTNTLALSLKNNEHFTLKDPFRLFIKRDDRAPKWQRYYIKAEPFNFSSNKGNIITGSLDTSSTGGSYSISIESISGQWAHAFLELDDNYSALHIDTLKLKGIWEDKGPLLSEHLLRLSGNFRKLKNLQASSHIASDHKSIKAKSAIELNSELLVSMDSKIPGILTPGSIEHWNQVADNDPLSVLIQTENTYAVSELFENLLHIQTQTPSFTLALHGTLYQPEGSVIVSAKSLYYETFKRNQKRSLQLNNFETYLRITPHELILENVDFHLGNRPIDFKAHWKTNDSSWLKTLTQPLLDFTGLEISLKGSNIPIEACSLLLPKDIKPEGHISINLDKQKKDLISGSFMLENAATLPLGFIGSIKNITSTITLKDKTISIQETSARIGEQPLHCSGDIDYSNIKSPAINMSFHGKDIPLVRSPGVIIRSDFNLHALTKETETTIKGSIHLHDSAVLMDFGSIKSSTTSANRPPPYFNVPLEPFATWKLAVDISGQDFLKINTPVFNSTLSANLELRGSLKTPLATGNIRFNEGSIVFPFALFKISQGNIRLEPQDPTQPKLDIKAKTRIYGYDARLNITGTAQQPMVQFSSSPSLSTSQIFAMISSGVVPQGPQTQTTGGRLGGLGVYIGNNLLAELGMTDHLGDRLQINVGEYITRSGRNTVNADYKINSDFSLLGEYDRFDAFNVDLKWKAYP